MSIAQNRRGWYGTSISVLLSVTGAKTRSTPPGALDAAPGH